MPKIVVTNEQDFSEEQFARLESLGDVTYYKTLPADGAEYLERIKGADIICSGAAGFKDVYQQLHDVYVTFAFVSVAFVKDFDVLKKNHVTISNAPGANKYAVSEWIVGMMIYLTRDFGQFIDRDNTYRVDGGLPPLTPGLATKKLTVLGKGNIGRRVGEVAESLGMEVCYFARGDNLLDLVRDADVVVDTLSSNSTTTNILDKEFFAAVKHGSYFVSVTRSENMDQGALIESIDSGRIAGAAMDCAGILVGDTDDAYYQKFLRHPKIVVTPHVSYNTQLSMQNGATIMIDNVEAFIRGKPQNVVE